MPVVSQAVVFADQTEHDSAHNVSVSFGASPSTTPTVEIVKEMRECPCVLVLASLCSGGRARVAPVAGARRG